MVLSRSKRRRSLHLPAAPLIVERWLEPEVAQLLDERPDRHEDVVAGNRGRRGIRNCRGIADGRAGGRCDGNIGSRMCDDPVRGLANTIAVALVAWRTGLLAYLDAGIWVHIACIALGYQVLSEHVVQGVCDRRYGDGDKCCESENRFATHAISPIEVDLPRTHDLPRVECRS